MVARRFGSTATRRRLNSVLRIAQGPGRDFADLSGDPHDPIGSRALGLPARASECGRPSVGSAKARTDHADTRCSSDRGCRAAVTRYTCSPHFISSSGRGRSCLIHFHCWCCRQAIAPPVGCARDVNDDAVPRFCPSRTHWIRRSGSPAESATPNGSTRCGGRMAKTSASWYRCSRTMNAGLLGRALGALEDDDRFTLDGSVAVRHRISHRCVSS